MGENPMVIHHLYVHIPFCRHKCGYCDFNAYAGMDRLMPDYVEALERELASMLETKNFGRLDTAKLEAIAGAPVARADPETARRATGYAIGGVPPFGHAQSLPVYMDRDLERYDVVWAAAGRPDAVFPITPARLQELSAARVEDLAQ